MQGQQPPNQSPPGRLVLPGADDTSFSPEQHTQMTNTPLEQQTANPIHTYNPGDAVRSHRNTGSMLSMPRVAPPTRTKPNWREDPAYTFLFIALGVVLLSSILFVAFAGSTFSSLLTQGGPSQTGSGSNVPAQGTTDTNPKFPTPGSNSGGTPINQPTTALPSPTATTVIATPSPVPTTQPSPTPTPNQQLTLQIVNAPGQVNNNTTVTLNVTASQPNVQVELSITYDVAPYIKIIGPQTTDNNGNASFQWNVQVRFFGRNQGTARIVAVGSDQNGHKATSQVVTVRIVGHGGVGG
ncbi:MAG TPA: hypothetical protein DHW02_12540 [Ktedonobacter sp.]|nr:hypothetical protein [Ktedonobacter sp.]